MAALHQQRAAARRFRNTGRAMDFEYFAQQMINGLTLGSIYGLIAIGYTMVFGIIGMVNFAHGDVFMLSTFVALIVLLLLASMVASGGALLMLALLITLLVAMVVTSAWNWAIEKVAYKKLRGSFRLAPLISAIGVSIVLVNLVQVIQGPRNKPVQPLITGDICIVGVSKAGRGCWIERANSFGVSLAWKQLVIMAVTALLLGLFWYLVQRTPLGRAQRACEQDGKMARLLGIDVDKTISITFIMGAALAAVAGVMYIIQYGVVSFNDGFVPGVKAFTAAVLGGIGSLPGAVLGGIIIGLIEALWSGYFSIDYKDVAAFTILAIVLIFMPQGLLGKPEVEKV
jgi:branched-chain amino acid transport system permease protein